jgi:hypothetical protein
MSSAKFSDYKEGDCFLDYLSLDDEFLLVVAQANISQITDIEELREIALNNLGYLFMYRRINDLLEDRVNKMNVFEEE